MQKFSDTQFRILLALAQFQFLTLDHFKRLGIAGNIDAFRRRLNELVKCRKPLVGAITFQDDATRGRLPYAYYLTKEGVRELEQSPEPPHVIRRPASAKEWPHDYQHRVKMITALTNAQAVAPLHIHGLYFGKSKTRKTDTNVTWHTKTEEKKSLTPDAIFSLGKAFAALEFTNNKNKWQRDKLKVFAYTKGYEHIKKKYGQNKNPRVLFIYDNAAKMQSFLEWGAGETITQKHQGLFLVKSLEDTENGRFAMGWRVLGHDQATHDLRVS